MRPKKFKYPAPTKKPPRKRDGFVIQKFRIQKFKIVSIIV